MWGAVFCGALTCGLLLAACAMEVEVVDESAKERIEAQKPIALWKVVEGSRKVRYGPRAYVTQRPIRLADGTEVLCVTSSKGLWCKPVFLGLLPTSPVQAPELPARSGATTSSEPDTLDFGEPAG